MNQLTQSTHIPTVAEFLDSIGPCPIETLILGMAADGLPTCYNLDFNAYPLFVHAPAGWGKTHMLKAVLKAALVMDTGLRKRQICPLVITPCTDEWADMKDLVTVQQCSDQVIDSALRATARLAVQAGRYQYVLLLVDGWEVISQEMQTRLLAAARQPKVCMLITSRNDDVTVVAANKIRAGIHPWFFACPEGQTMVEFFTPSL